jgi:serine/threonine protein kinase
MAWETGQTLQAGKYTIEGVLGVGGFGITYLAKDAIGQPVVIKTLNDAAQRDSRFEQLQQDFVNEALWLAKCAHPHIVQIHRVVQEAGLWCLVMEYIAGENLCHWVKRRGVFSEAEALQYIQQVGDALTLMHQNGLLHRDVKPENIMLRSGRAEVVLLDLGIAREFVPNSTQTHTAILSNGYAPIEQYEYQARRGAYSDVYGLAATLYFLLTGEVPKDAQIRAYSLLRYHTDPLDAVQQLNPQISEATSYAIQRGMAVEASDRPQSIQEWLALLPEIDSLPQFPVSNSVPLMAAFPGIETDKTFTTHLPPERRSAVATLPLMPPTPPETPAQVDSLPTRRWGQWIGITAVAVVVSAVLGSTLARWWLQQQTTTRLAEAQQLQAEGRYEDCIASVTSMSRTSELAVSNDAQQLIDQCARGVLNRAKEQAANAEYAQAIQEAVKVPADSAVGQEAETLISDWSDALIQQATTMYQEEGRLEEAIALLQVVPDSTPLSRIRQETIQKWQTEWERNETTFAEAEQALDLGDWYGARTTANALTTSYWQNQAADLRATADAQIAAIEAEEQRRQEQAAQEAAERQQETSLAAAHDRCLESGGNNGGEACQNYAQLCEANGGVFVADANFVDCLPMVEPDKRPKEEVAPEANPSNQTRDRILTLPPDQLPSAPQLIVPIPGER